MNIVPVLALPPYQQWDQALVCDLLGGYLCPPGYQFTHVARDGSEPMVGFAVVLVPGRYDEAEQRVRDLTRKMDGALVIVTGDEESSFRWQEIDHPNLRWWFMDPRPHLDYPEGSHFLGSGYPPHLRALLAPHRVGMRDLDWSFSGQVNHPRRVEVVEELGKLIGGEVHRTPGFTRGLNHEDYARLLARSKTVACPSGPYSPDSFRLHEALEAGAVPIADATCPAYDAHGYWQQVFEGPVPFQEVDDWSDVSKMIDAAVLRWPHEANICSAWWQAHKRKMRRWLVDDLRHFGQEPAGLDSQITVVIPTSPIPSHPSLAIIEETIASVRHWLPTAEILVMIDGVRDEQAHRENDYAEYQRRLLWRMNFDYERVTPIRFYEHRHQAAMMRYTLELIDTPLVLFVEHDTPLVTDEPIDMDGCADLIRRGDLNVVRFFHEAVRQPDHRHLELDDEPLIGMHQPYVRTIQWSQRPHLASTAFYRSMLDRHFSAGARTMIEDVLHGKAEEDWLRDGPMAWNLWRIGIYAPGDNLKRSFHLDGRQGDPKFDDRFVV